LIDTQYPKLWEAIELSDFDSVRHELLGRSALRHPEAQAFIFTAVGLFAKAIEQVTRSLPRSAAGAPTDTRLHELIATLAVFYQNETKQRPTITTNPIKAPL